MRGHDTPKQIPSPEEIAKLPPDGGPHFNRLIFEKSPYLLQHAANPVDWYAWGEEGFRRAAELDCPIFLSIGYSTCHWCHVMENESFEDESVADILNKHFISVKVDREERPDVDSIYMSACQAMTGSGGWPLTIVMTPDRKPFFAGTYFPPESRLGHVGLKELLSQLARLWENDRGKVLEAAEQMAGVLQEPKQPGGSTENLGLETLRDASEYFARAYDRSFGGFGSAPKFPSPHNYSFLLRWRQRSGDKAALQMVAESLGAMRMGGIFDHVGFGFHRYSTDRRWLVPHFEKMLYDQAMLIIAFVEAHQATGDSSFADVVRESIAYLERDMTATEGAFCSAEDADSEGEEGKFYLWTLREWMEVLGEDDGSLFAETFNISERGNFTGAATGSEPGLNIPYMRQTWAALATQHRIGLDALQRRWESARQRLLAVRSKRARPHRDDKILTAWNGLMIAALSKASQPLDEPRYADMARKAADFVLQSLRRSDGRLLRRYRKGEAGLPAYADDYAFLIWGLIELYEATFEVRYLREAFELNSQMLSLFWDSDGGGFCFVGSDGEQLIARNKETYDGAVPAANSVAALNLLRLGRITGDTALETRAHELFRSEAPAVRQIPGGFAQLLIALDLALGPTREILVTGKRGVEATEQMLRTVRQRFLPRKVLLFRSDDESAREIIEIAPFVEHQPAIDGGATAYVCENYACREPVSSAVELGRLLDEEIIQGRGKRRG